MKPDDMILDFGAFSLEAELFDTAIAQRFKQHLPCQVRLMQWGNELYGSVGKDLGEENPVPDIPPGGIAYTRQGNYVCIFFGQTPAWTVEHIGQIKGDQWKMLVKNPSQDSVRIQFSGA
jgi:uncharacterized protein